MKIRIKAALAAMLVWGLVCAGTARAEVIPVDTGWEFQRLDSRQLTGAVRNQGSDWASQFQVDHVASGGVLAVDADTLARESAFLQQGGWEKVDLPHTAFTEPLTVIRPWQGICYYRRTLRAPEAWKEKNVWLEFKGAMHLADVWVNGRHLLQHAGGYLPFVADLGDALRYGSDNEILVRLDNRDNGLIPPGKPLHSLDFCYYSGLYRGVQLWVKSKQHITHPALSDRPAGGGVFVRYPSVSADRAQVQIDCEVANTATRAARGLTLRHSLYRIDGLFGNGRKGKRVAQWSGGVPLEAGGKRTLRALLTLERPDLWSPEAPHLYCLTTELLDGGRVIDRQQTRLGIRTIEFSRERGFRINGQPLRLVGSNRHMEYPYVGNALPAQAQYRDIYQIRTHGFNIVRLGHYPQDPSVLDACDELGLLAIEPIPGWQYFNRDTVFTGHTFRDIRQLIRRDRNHPSVVMWETTLNESWPPDAWKDEAVRTAHEEYPGDQCYTSGDSYGYEGFDVCYNDWQEGFRRPNAPPRAGFIREYYDYEFGGHYSTSRIRRADGEEALLQNAWNAQWSHNRYRKQYPATAGDAVWSMYDYNRGGCDNICYSGVADLFRLPKYSLYFFSTQIRPGTPQPGGPKQPELFIATRWEPAPGRQDTVRVFGNVDEVALYADGRPVGRRNPDNGPDTEYVPQADGGNCRQLASPPFTFAGVPRVAGRLKAVGYCGGRPATETEVATPGEPVRLAIDYFESGRPASRRDLLIVYVALADGQGTQVPLNGRPVSLKAEGGEICGPAHVETEAGVASFLVRTGDARRLKLQAVSDDLSAQRRFLLK